MRLIYSERRTSALRPGILIDRDGVINRRIVDGYVRDWNDFSFMHGVRAALARISNLGFPMIVVSNQSGVGKGLVRREDLSNLTNKCVAELARNRIRIDAVYYCLHRPEEKCRCRKPNPGLLETAAKEWFLDLGRSVLIGDSRTDVETGLKMNCRVVFFAPQADARWDYPPERVRIVHRIRQISGVVAGWIGRSPGTAV